MKKFIVSNPKETEKYLYIIIAIFVLVTIISTFAGKQSPLPYIISFSILLFPFIIGVIWMNTYKIIVNDKKITVDSFFRRKYTIDASEITIVKWTMTLNKNGFNENIKVKTEHRKFTFATMMNNFDKMSAFIKENVDAEKIIVSKINFINKKRKN